MFLPRSTADSANNRMQEFAVSTPVPAIRITCAPTVTPRWGVDPVVVAGSTNGAVAGDTVTVDWGDGTSITSGIPIDSTTGQWGPVDHMYSSSAIATNPNSVVAKLFSSTNVLKGTSTAVSVTVKPHATSLTLTLTPSKVTSGTLYTVSGMLKDTVINAGVGSKTITFTATSPIVISSAITNAAGTYTVSGNTAPAAGSYSIIAHFAGDSSYSAKDSTVMTLTVT